MYDMNSKTLKFVIDVDDVILHKKLGGTYENCIANKNVIEKINSLVEEHNAYIILYTSRGMFSCNNDVLKAEIKNRGILEKWLKEHNVKYNELIFGKPLGDYYVDDRCISVNNFVNSEYEELKGGSNSSIIGFGDYIRKDLKADVATNNFKLWLLMGGEAFHPKVHSYLYNLVFMDYVNGKSLAEYGVTFSIAKNVIELINAFKAQKCLLNSFDVNEHIKILQKNKVSLNGNFDAIIDKVAKYLISDKSQNLLNKNISFCHGDLTLSNILCDKDTDKLVLIDPNFNHKASSYLLDIAKMKMSLDGYDEKFCGGTKVNKKIINFLVKQFECMLTAEEYELVEVLELMYICRLYRYKNNKQKKQVEIFAEQKYNELIKVGVKL